MGGEGGSPREGKSKKGGKRRGRVGKVGEEGEGCELTTDEVGEVVEKENSFL